MISARVAQPEESVPISRLGPGSCCVQRRPFLNVVAVCKRHPSTKRLRRAALVSRTLRTCGEGRRHETSQSCEPSLHPQDQKLVRQRIRRRQQAARMCVGQADGIEGRGRRGRHERVHRERRLNGQHARHSRAAETQRCRNTLTEAEERSIPPRHRFAPIEAEAAGGAGGRRRSSQHLPRRCQDA